MIRIRKDHYIGTMPRSRTNQNTLPAALSMLQHVESRVNNPRDSHQVPPAGLSYRLSRLSKLYADERPSRWTTFRRWLSEFAARLKRGWSLALDCSGHPADCGCNACTELSFAPEGAAGPQVFCERPFCWDCLEYVDKCYCRPGEG